MTRIVVASLLAFGLAIAPADAGEGKWTPQQILELGLSDRVTLAGYHHNPYPWIARARAMILAHPHSTDNYYYDDYWPGAGLGRELPVLGALGALDALDQHAGVGVGSFRQGARIDATR